MGEKKVKRKAPKKRASKRVLHAAASEPGDGERHIAWRMGQIDFTSEWGWQNLDPADAEELKQELVVFEREPLRTLKDKRWVKFIPTKDMEHRAAERLHELERDEEGLWQLHLSRHKWRVWGFLEDASFHIFWWDPEHNVCTGHSRTRRS